MASEEEVGEEKVTARVYLKASVADAERLPDGRWLVRGHGWLKEGVEFSEEDFRNNFEVL